MVCLADSQEIRLSTKPISGGRVEEEEEEKMNAHTTRPGNNFLYCSSMQSQLAAPALPAATQSQFK